MYQLAITKTASKQLNKLPKQIQNKINPAIQNLKSWEGNIKKLESNKNEYRLRVGNFRIVFILENGIIYIADIKDRKDIYKF